MIARRTLRADRTKKRRMFPVKFSLNCAKLSIKFPFPNFRVVRRKTCFPTQFHRLISFRNRNRVDLERGDDGGPLFRHREISSRNRNRVICRLRLAGTGDEGVVERPYRNFSTLSCRVFVAFREPRPQRDFGSRNRNRDGRDLPKFRVR
jgi:hypothetical protein